MPTPDPATKLPESLSSAQGLCEPMCETPHARDLAGSPRAQAPPHDAPRPWGPGLRTRGHGLLSRAFSAYRQRASTTNGSPRNGQPDNTTSTMKMTIAPMSATRPTAVSRVICPPVELGRPLRGKRQAAMSRANAPTARSSRTTGDESTKSEAARIAAASRSAGRVTWRCYAPRPRRLPLRAR
jgi:hypothetical protein